MELEQLTLHSDRDISSAIELPLLPALSTTSHTNFVVFPRDAPTCTPRTFGRRVQSLPKFSIYRLHRVVLNGFRLFCSEEKLFTDASLTSANPLFNSTRFREKLARGQVEDLNPEHLDTSAVNAIEISRDGDILLPCSDEPANFGSWIYRFMPKLLLSNSHAQFTAVLVYQQNWMTELIRFLGIECELIRHDPRKRYHVHAPLIPSLPAPEVFLRPEILAAVEPLHSLQDNSTSLGDRIYVSRRSQSLRRPTMRALENETGLVAALQSMGFKEFIPENYGFAQQMAIFDRAKVIVGCGGSNMFGCIFARHAALVVDIESSEEWEHAHSNLLSSMPFAWSMVHGKQTSRGSHPHINWTIDVDVFSEGLRRLI